MTDETSNPLAAMPALPTLNLTGEAPAADTNNAAADTNANDKHTIHIYKYPRPPYKRPVKDDRPPLSQSEILLLRRNGYTPIFNVRAFGQQCQEFSKQVAELFNAPAAQAALQQQTQPPRDDTYNCSDVAVRTSSDTIDAAIDAECRRIKSLQAHYRQAYSNARQEIWSEQDRLKAERGDKYDAKSVSPAANAAGYGIQSKIASAVLTPTKADNAAPGNSAKSQPGTTVAANGNTNGSATTSFSKTATTPANTTGRLNFNRPINHQLPAYVTQFNASTPQIDTSATDREYAGGDDVHDFTEDAEFGQQIPSMPALLQMLNPLVKRRLGAEDSSALDDAEVQHRRGKRSRNVITPKLLERNTRRRMEVAATLIQQSQQQQQQQQQQAAAKAQPNGKPDSQPNTIAPIDSALPAAPATAAPSAKPAQPISIPPSVARASVGAKEMILRVSIMSPSPATRYACTTEMLVLGRQPLTVLRDHIYCQHHTFNRHDGHGNVDGNASNAYTLPSNSGFFLIDQHIYEDHRAQGRRPATDTPLPSLVKHITEWIVGEGRYQQSHLPVYTRAPSDMLHTTFADLHIALGAHYLYAHDTPEHGMCYHTMVFNEITQRTSTDYASPYAYPLIVYQQRQKRQHCHVCKELFAHYVCDDDELATTNPAFYCTGCYEAAHTSANGQPVSRGCKTHPYKHD